MFAWYLPLFMLPFWAGDNSSDNFNNPLQQFNLPVLKTYEKPQPNIFFQAPPATHIVKTWEEDASTSNIQPQPRVRPVAELPVNISCRKKETSSNSSSNGSLASDLSDERFSFGAPTEKNLILNLQPEEDKAALEKTNKPLSIFQTIFSPFLRIFSYCIPR